jgi:hypothetical protein
MTHPKVGDALVGDFWPEPVRMLTVQPLGTRVRLEAVGTQTQQLYSRILQTDDLAHVRVVGQTQWGLVGHGEATFLAIEAHRIQFAHQFDPLLAVNVSQVDPLPHQIEAVYHYMLCTPRIRFLLADDPGAGKTIMTGLLLKELKYRGLVHHETLLAGLNTALRPSRVKCALLPLQVVQAGIAAYRTQGRATAC